MPRTHKHNSLFDQKCFSRALANWLPHGSPSAGIPVLYSSDIVFVDMWRSVNWSSAACSCDTRDLLEGDDEEGGVFVGIGTFSSWLLS